MQLRGLSQEALGAQIGLSHVAIGGWQRGARPRAATAAKLADFFRIPIEDLFDDEKPLPREVLRENVAQKIRTDAEEARRYFPDDQEKADLYNHLKFQKEQFMRLLAEHNALGKRMKELIEEMPPYPQNLPKK